MIRLFVFFFLVAHIQFVSAQFNTPVYQKRYNSVQVREPIVIPAQLATDTVFVKEIQTDTIYLESSFAITTKPNAESVGNVFSPLESLMITSPYGMRFHPIKKRWLFHSGVDFRAYQDTVRSVLDGTVHSSGYDNGLGYFVKIEHNSYVTTYGHLSQYFHLAGVQVKAGEPLGITGNTGLSTGEHLHFSVHHNGSPVDPLQFLKSLLKIRNTLAFNTHEKREHPTISN